MPLAGRKTGIPGNISPGSPPGKESRSGSRTGAAKSSLGMVCSCTPSMIYTRDGSGKASIDQVSKPPKSKSAVKSGLRSRLTIVFRRFDWFRKVPVTQIAEFLQAVTSNSRKVQHNSLNGIGIQGPPEIISQVKFNLLLG